MPTGSADPAGAILGSAACQACGGAVPVSISMTAPVCRYCGSTSPLSPRLGARLERIAGLLARRTAREEQLVGRQARLGTSFTVPMLCFGLLPAWFVVALISVLAFPRPRGAGLFRFLFLEPPRAGSEGTVLWWVLWALATGFALTTSLWGIGLLNLRRLVSFTSPEPPALPGDPLRCRCCGSGLEGPGPILRCRSCRADHILGAGATLAAEESLEKALARYESRLSASLATRVKRALRLLTAAGVGPIAVALLAPAGLLAPGAPALLWSVPVILLVAGGALLLAASRVDLPEVRTLEAAKRGDTVEIDGTRWSIVGVLRLGGMQSWCGVLALLAPDERSPVARALHVRTVAGREDLGLTELELDDAVEIPAEAGNGSYVESYPVSASKGSEWLGGTDLNAVVQVRDGRMARLVLHAGRAPIPEVAPIVGLRAVSTPEEAEVLLVASRPGGG